MSIAAYITDVVEGDDPRLILGPLENGDGPGQPSLRVVNRPCPPLKGFVGLKIWGPSECIMSKEKKIADRIGYTRIRLLSFLLLTLFAAPLHAEILKTETFEVTLDARSIATSLTFNGNALAIVKNKTIKLGDNRIPDSCDIVKEYGAVWIKWKFTGGDYLKVQYTPRARWIEVQIVESKGALGQCWLFAAFTDKVWPFNAAGLTQAMQLDDDCFLGILPLGIDCETMATHEVEPGLDRRGALIQPLAKAPFGHQQFAVYVCRKSELKSLPVEIEKQVNVKPMQALKLDSINGEPYLFITPHRGDDEKYGKWPTPEYVIGWCKKAGIRRVWILTWMLFEYHNTTVAYKPTKWADDIIPKLHAAGITVGAHTNFYLPEENAYVKSRPGKWLKNFDDPEVAHDVFTQDVPTIQEMGRIVGHQYARWKIDEIYHDVQTGDYFARVFVNTILETIRSDGHWIRGWRMAGSFPDWDSATSPYDMHIGGMGGRQPLPQHLKEAGEMAVLTSVVKGKEYGWYQRYGLPTGQFTAEPANKEINDLYFADCKLYDMPVGIKISGVEMKWAEADGTLAMVAETIKFNRERLQKETDAFVRHLLLDGNGKEIQTFVNERLGR